VHGFPWGEIMAQVIEQKGESDIIVNNLAEANIRC
jgi:hypothetical protein